MEYTETLTVDEARALLEGGAACSELEPAGDSLPDADEEPGSDSDEAAPAVPDGNVGLGIDVVEIERMRALLERSEAFAPRVFSDDERAYCDGKANPASHYATRFAAKEAVVKALGTGFTQGIDVRDIEVVRAPSGKPSIKLYGRAAQVAAELGVREISVSLTFTHLEAVACAMAITEASVRATEARKDPMEELAKQFKELRGVLDEL